jgi:hypothetical protein
MMKMYKTFKNGWGDFYPSGETSKNGWGDFHPSGETFKNGWGDFHPSGETFKNGWGDFYPSGETFKRGFVHRTEECFDVSEILKCTHKDEGKQTQSMICILENTIVGVFCILENTVLIQPTKQPQWNLVTKTCFNAVKHEVSIA